MTLQEVLSRVNGAQRCGDGWRALCPAHDDHNPSLSIAEKDGKLLLHCHAGCSYEQIIAAVDDQAQDGRGKVTRTEVCSYLYTDAEGQRLYEVVRFDPKGFAIRHSEGKRKVWGLGEVRPVLYCLPKVIEAVASKKPIYVAEGEKDVEALVAAGACATCNPMGAGKWRPEYGQY